MRRSGHVAWLAVGLLCGCAWFRDNGPALLSVVDVACQIAAPSPEAKQICVDARELGSVLTKIALWQSRKGGGTFVPSAKSDAALYGPRPALSGSPVPVLVQLPEGMTAADL